MNHVIFIHGAFCGGWAMENLARAFISAGYETHLPDLRHHARKLVARDLKHLGITSMRDYAADFRKLISAMSEKPVLVGHSMGGLIAQMIASHGLARAVVLLAPSAPWGVLPSHWNEVASGFGLYLNGHYWEQPLIPTFEIAAEHTLKLLGQNEQRAVFAQMVPESGRALFEVLQWWLDISRATEVSAHSINCPVFCAAGELDAVNPPETVRRIAARYREHATFRLYKNMGHWLIGEPGWEEVASDALRWLKDLRS